MDRISKWLLIILQVFAILVPIFYLSAYLYRIAWLNEFELTIEKYPLSIHEYIANGGLLYFQKLVKLVSLTPKSWPPYLIGLFIILSYISREFLFTKLLIVLRMLKLYEPATLLVKNIKYSIFKAASNQEMLSKLESRFRLILYGNIFALLLLSFFLLLLTGVYISYSDGEKTAISIANEIEENESFELQEGLTTVCHKGDIKIKGHLIADSQSHFAIFSSGMVYQFTHSNDLLLINNKW